MADRDPDAPEPQQDPAPPRAPNEGIAPVARSAAGIQNVNTLNVFLSPVTKVTLKSVTFTSDHGVIKDNTSDWQNTGALYKRPHWEAAAAGTTVLPTSPVSHTKSAAVHIDVEIEVAPDNAMETAAFLAGTATFGDLTLTAPVVLQGGPVTIHAVGTALTLKPDTVAKLSGNIAWKITEAATSKVHDLGSSKGHTVFATLGTPVTAHSQKDQGFTDKRMDKAIQLVAQVGSSDPHAIAKALVFMVPGYTLTKDASVPSQLEHPYYDNLVGGAWCLLDHIAKKAECQAIARMAYAVMMTVGTPGKIGVRAVWADPNNGGNPKEDSLKPDVGLGKTTKMVGSKMWEAALVDTYPVEGAVYSKKPGAPNYIGINHLEACLRVEHGGTTTYYAAGAGVYASPAKVLTCFHALCWLVEEVQSLPNNEKVTFITVMQVVKRWKDENGKDLP